MIARILALSLAASSTLVATDWPQRRGPSHNGISTETAWKAAFGADGPKQLWKASVGTGFSGVVIADGRAFTMGSGAGEKDFVVALDAGTGKELWRFTYAEPLNPKMYEGGPNSTPTVDGGSVYTASRSGKVHCLDAATGGIKWTVDLQQTAGNTKSDWGVSGAPLIVGEKLILNFGNGPTVLAKDSGKKIWSAGGGENNSFNTPVVTKVRGEAVVLAHQKKELIGFRLADGKRLFGHKFGKGYETHCSDPVLTSAGVFISSGDDGGELLDLSSGQPKQVWKNMNLSTFTCTAVAIGDVLYGHDSAGYKRANQEFRCVDIKTGAIKWSLGGFGQGSVIAAGDRLIVLSDNGELAILKATPDKAEILARTQALGGKTWTQPALADGKLYLRNAKGDVVCLDLNG